MTTHTTTPPPVTPARTPLHQSSLLAFIGTTVALVLLASLGTAILVQFGSGGARVTPPRAIDPVASGPALGPSQARQPIAVDRVVGSFHAPGAGPITTPRGVSLGELLSPGRDPRPTTSPSPAPPSLPLAFPTGFPTALPTGPPPSPIALPLPVQVPGPITIPLPGPLPDLVLFPGGLITTSPSPLPLSLP